MAVKVFENVRLDKEFLDGVLNYDYTTLEFLDSVVLSQYCIALAQYNVYLKYQVNKLKVETLKIRRFIDSVVFNLLTEEILKKNKTKADAKEYIISTNEELNSEREKLESFEYELTLMEGMDKSLQELINAFKKELSRRENELYATRMERK